MVAIYPENIPAEVKALPQWVMWKKETRDGKPAKVPYQPNGKRAKSNDPSTWSTFNTALTTFQDIGGFDGICWMMHVKPSDIIFIDIDHCIKDGIIEPWAQQIVDEFDSYTERSQSGNGLHILIKGKKPIKRCRKAGSPFEIYDCLRPCYITGDVVGGHTTIEARQEALDWLFEKIFAAELQQADQGPAPKPSPAYSSLSDEALILKATLSKGGNEFKLLFDGSTLGYGGDDSAADMALMNKLAFWTGGNALQMERLFSASGLGRREKWRGRPDYRERTIRKAISDAREFYEPPKDSVSTGPKVAPSEILERIEAVPRALKELDILAALSALKANDPIEYDLLLESIKKAGTGIKVATINELVDKHIQESEKAAEKPQETPEAIKEKAREIAARGDPFKFLIWQAQRNHLGDIDYQKVLIASIASASSQTSNGIQPGGNGDKGSGKSDACAATYHLVPMDRRLDGSLSPMSLFYLQEMDRLRAGMILFSDDVEYDGIIPIYKRSTARFQHGITHFSVSGGKERKGIELIVPPRMVWWLTSVESVANEQAFDRQYPISTDSSPAHKQRVSREIADRRARKELRLAEDEGIEVARQIIADIFNNGPFKVLIPQSAKTKWLKVADFRGQEQFWDLVDALVILRWRQHKEDVDGWLIAEDQDLIEAKAILTGHKVAHYADLTEAEAKLIGVMSSDHSMTQKELTEALGVAQSTLSERLRSIMAKSAIITEDFDQGKKVYALNPKMQIGEDFWSGLDLVELKIENREAYRSQQIALSGCYRYVIGLPIGIIINNSNRIPSSLSVNVEGSIERDTCSCENCLGWKESVPSSILPTDKTTDNDQKPQQAPLSDTDKSTETEPIRTDNANSGHADIPIRQAGDTETNPGFGPHPRKDEPTPIRKKSAKEDPELQKFKANVRSRSKNTCRLCGRHFEVPPTICYPGGYICEPCRRDGPPSEPAKIDSQSKLEAGQ